METTTATVPVHDRSSMLDGRHPEEEKERRGSDVEETEVRPMVSGSVPFLSFSMAMDRGLSLEPWNPSYPPGPMATAVDRPHGLHSEERVDR
eukprot:scaffold524_cov357-Pavlova_lutheri.AAC.39